MKRINVSRLAMVVAIALVICFVVVPASALAASQPDDSSGSTPWVQAYCTYTVRSGDLLSRIAVRFGTSYRELAALNKLSNPNKIYPGTVLSVPCAPSTTTSGSSGAKICAYYVVRPGDYLKSIAVRYATTWQAIASANHLSNPNLIHVGARLAIPCGPAPAPDTSTWKSWVSTKHNYVVSYPADWTIDVKTSGPGHDPEYVYLRPPVGGLPQVQMLAQKDAPPITGFENCNKNLQFKGVPACSISLPKGQNPATQLLIFQKGGSYYQLAMQYDAQQQLAVFEEIVKSFQFKP